MNKYIINIKSKVIAIAGIIALTIAGFSSHAQESPKEEDFFKILKVSTPEGTLLEVGGLAVLPSGDLGVSTRRGDVFIIENPTSRKPHVRKFASGLHEILGLAYKDGALYCAQRGELTKLMDTNRDGKADVIETIYAWPISGHYHEYSFGPKIAPDGSFFVTGNVAFGSIEWWRGESFVPWRGWAMRITEDGKMQPWATGMRSPAGLGMIDGELFYTDNQGDWVGTGGIYQVSKGDFMGHPAGLRWADHPLSPVKLKEATFKANVDERKVITGEGKYHKPENVVNEPLFTNANLKEKFPDLRLPSVILPHGVLGISNSEIIKIPDGTFGPFEGQLLVGDQGQSKIMRVYMEKINGEYQGAAWDFRSGFQSGVLRMAFAPDNSLFVGMTNRGWGSAGEANEGLQRLVYNNKVPFEMRTIKAMPDGFEVEFTLPVDRKSAEDLASYSVESFTYKYHPVYGSPKMNNESHPVKGVKVSEDGLTARIIVDNLRKNYVHNITLNGIREKNNSYSLVHPTVYYTLNNIPQGAPLALSEVSVFNSVEEANKQAKPTKNQLPKNAMASTGGGSTGASARQKAESEKKTPTLEEVMPLLTKNTCTACHAAEKRQVGPSYVDIAKRKYTPQQIVDLIYNPKPENWPGYSSEMPPMPQVPKDEALKIAEWINSLNK
jgi:cytochrome c551/c552